MVIQEYVRIGKDVPIPKLAVKVVYDGFDSISTQVLDSLHRDHTSMSEIPQYILLGVYAMPSQPSEMYAGVRHIFQVRSDGDWAESGNLVTDSDEMAKTAMVYLSDAKRAMKEAVLLVEEAVEKDVVAAFMRAGVEPVLTAELK